MTRSDTTVHVSELADLVSTLRDEVRELRREVAAMQRTAVSHAANPNVASNGAAPQRPTSAAKPRALRPPSGELPPDTYEIVFDGGSQGNPGRGYGSFVLFSAGGSPTLQTLDYSSEGQQVTNNQAEYLTLIRALQRLHEELGSEAGTATVSIWGDSSLVVNQVNGTWRVKHPELQPLVLQARALLESFAAWTIRWHDRSKSVRLLGH